MSYQSVTTALLGAASTEGIVSSVESAVATLITSQGFDTTTEIHRFMLYHTGKMDVRITAMMKHIDARQPKRENNKIPDLKDTGISCGWRSVDNSKEQINHLLIGLPFMYAILITTVTDKLASTKRIHSVVGTFTNNEYKAMGTNPEAQTETVSSYKEVKRLLGYLDKLTQEQPIIPIVKDETKTISYANAQYEARWINSDGSLPHKSTTRPTP